MNEFLYDEYCTQLAPPRVLFRDAQQLAERLADRPADTVDQVCDIIRTHTCRVSNDQAESTCPGATADTVVLQCGQDAPQCYTRQELLTKVAQNPYVRLQLGPKQMRKLNNMRRESNASCFERRGSRQFCQENSQCEYTTPNFWERWLGYGSDCQVQSSEQAKPCTELMDQDNIIMDLFLRFMDARNVEVSRRLKQKVRANLKVLTFDQKCELIKKHQVVAPHKQATSVAALLLGPDDLITINMLPQKLQRIVDPSTLQNLIALLNLTSAALVINAPWWLYLTLYSSGRVILWQVLNNQHAGRMFVLSMLLTGMKGNWFFKDLQGLFDYIDLSIIQDWLSNVPIDIKAVATTVAGVLVRKM
jgi:hypothetical protein